MKYLLYALAIITFTSCGGSGAASYEAVSKEGELNWLTMNEALALNEKAPKKMLVDVYTHWCGPCKMMDRMTFKDEAFIKHVAENYYPVKFDAESPEAVAFKGKEYANPGYKPNVPKNRRNSPHQLTRVLGVSAYPTLVVIDENLNIQKSIRGFRQAPELLPEL